MRFPTSKRGEGRRAHSRRKFALGAAVCLLALAACLAAWFSQARDSSKVPVDYTPVKYVKKPNGARPGMVTYTTYETAWVTPDGELAKRLRVK